MPTFSKSDAERFWSKVKVLGSDDCWEWQAGYYPDGYGIFWAQGRNWRANRFVLLSRDEETHLDALHTCDNSKCVNPKHIYAGTASDNANDAFRRNRRPREQKHLAGIRCENHGMARLTNEQVLEIRQNNYSARFIQEKYCVSKSQAYRIKKGEHWRELIPRSTGN